MDMKAENDWEAWAEQLEALWLDQRTTLNHCWCHYGRTVQDASDHDVHCRAVQAALRAKPGGSTGTWEAEISEAEAHTRKIVADGRRYWEGVVKERRERVNATYRAVGLPEVEDV